MENEEQEGQDRIRKEYFKVHDDRGLCDNNTAPPNGDGTKSHGNKHSYFLRAKTPRFMGFQVTDHEDGRPSPSPICKPFLSSKSSEEECSIQSEEEDLANCLVMLSNNKSSGSSSDNNHMKDKEIAMEKGMFQCKACKKVFNSHQALGGHRASHKKVKGCFASKLDGINEDDEDEDIINKEEPAASTPSSSEMDASRKRMKMHECSVCRRVFSSGQALGGHKRCHWLTTSTDNAAFIPNFQYHHHHDHHIHTQQQQQLCNKPTMLITKHDHHHQSHHHHHHQLDLNLNLPPPPPQHDHNHHDHDINKTSTRLCLQQWPNHNQQKIDKEVIDKNGEKGCGMKLRKLSDLRDVNMDGGWLQMGIASNTTEMR